MGEKESIEKRQQVDTDRIFTLPNIMSMVRLALIPLIVYLFERGEYGWTLAVLILSGATDVVDGWIARTFHLVSDFGKAIDPIADKLTQIAVMLLLLPMRSWWVVGLLVAKEFVIGILSLITMRRTHNVYSAGWYGKLCTVVIYLSMMVLLLWREPAPIFVLIDTLVIAGLILLSFVKYFLYFRMILRNTEKQA